MKGPHERVKYDFRRLWECPACHHRERAAGEFPARICGCQQNVPLVKQVVMRLVEEGGRRVIPEYPHPAIGQSAMVITTTEAVTTDTATPEAPTTVAIVSPPLPEAPTIIETTAVPPEPAIERSPEPPPESV